MKFFHDATERNTKLYFLYPACLNAKAMYIIDPTFGQQVLLTRNCCKCQF